MIPVGWSLSLASFHAGRNAWFPCHFRPAHEVLAGASGQPAPRSLKIFALTGSRTHCTGLCTCNLVNSDPLFIYSHQYGLLRPPVWKWSLDNRAWKLEIQQQDVFLQIPKWTQRVICITAPEHPVRGTPLGLQPKILIPNWSFFIAFLSSSGVWEHGLLLSELTF